MSDAPKTSPETTEAASGKPPDKRTEPAADDAQAKQDDLQAGQDHVQSGTDSAAGTGPARHGTESAEASASAPDAKWEAALNGDRDAFEAVISSHLQELRRAAKRELRYHVAMGDFGRDDLTPEELVGEVIVRAWQDRSRKPQSLSIRTWLLALLFRVTRSLARDERRFRKLASVSLERKVPPEPVYDDDEEFWEWYQPDEMTRWEDVVDSPVMTPEEIRESDEELLSNLDPRAREAFLLYELHRAPLREVAIALGVSIVEAGRLIETARQHLGLESDKQMP